MPGPGGHHGGPGGPGGHGGFGGGPGRDRGGPGGPGILEEEDPLWMVGGLRWAAATAAAGGSDLHPLAEAADAAAVCSL